MLLIVVFSGLMQSLIIGIAASAIVAIVIELIRRRQKRFHVLFYHRFSQLYIPRNAGDVGIKVNYKTKDIKTALVVMHVCLENDGREDIMFSTHFSTKVRIHCQGYSFVAVNSEKNDCLPVFEQTEDGDLLLSWDILKKGEKIKFELVAESKDDLNGTLDDVACYNSLSFSFRSDCLDKIVPEKAFTYEDARERNHKRLRIGYKVLIISFALSMIMYDMFVLTRYNLTLDNGQTLEESAIMFNPVIDRYIISSRNDGTVFIPSAEMKGALTVAPIDKHSYLYVYSIVSQLLYVFLFIVVAISAGYEGVRALVKSLKKKKE